MAWIQTRSGRRFQPLDPDPEAVDIGDIAHSLSLLCRFNGHCRVFYSVAEHSVRVSRVLGAEHALAGLLHDAAEAYVSDLPRPVKAEVPLFGTIEDRLLEVIFHRYGAPWPLSAAVRLADDVLLATELRDLMEAPPVPWGVDAAPLGETIEPWTDERARQAFLDAFHALSGR